MSKHAINIDSAGVIMFTRDGDSLQIDVMCGAECPEEMVEFTRAAAKLIEVHAYKVAQEIQDGLDASGDSGAGDQEQGDGPGAPGIGVLDSLGQDHLPTGDGDPD